MGGKDFVSVTDIGENILNALVEPTDDPAAQSGSTAARSTPGATSTQAATALSAHEPNGDGQGDIRKCWSVDGSADGDPPTASALVTTTRRPRRTCSPSSGDSAPQTLVSPDATVSKDVYLGSVAMLYNPDASAGLRYGLTLTIGC